MGGKENSDSTVAAEDVEAGDILLVTQHPTNAIAALIVELDRSPSGFSHAGVADATRLVVSSYPHYQPDDLFDLGGLRHDPFEHFWDEQQSVHRLVLPDGRTNAAAADELRRYPDDREGAFGFAKVVIVAAALHALLPENPISREDEFEVVKRAIDAGEAWRSEEDFFCAEFVAHLYGHRFTIADLRPPPYTGKRRAGAPSDRIPDGLTPAAVSVGAGWLSLFASSKQRRALWALKKAIWKHDEGFFHQGIDVVFGDRPTPYRSITRRREESKLDEDEVVPPALVTPRMLEMWGRRTEILAGSPLLR